MNGSPGLPYIKVRREERKKFKSIKSQLSLGSMIEFCPWW